VRTTLPLWTPQASPHRSRIRRLLHRSVSPHRRPCLLLRRNECLRSMICRLHRRCVRPHRRICRRWFSTLRPLCRLWTKMRTMPSHSCQVRPAYQPHRSHTVGPTPAMAPSRSSHSSADGAHTLEVPGPLSHHGERTPPRASLSDGEMDRPSSQETPPLRAPSREPSDTMSLHRLRYRPPYGDTICKWHRVGYGEDAALFYGRTLPSPCHHEKTSGRLTPATNDEFGGTRPRPKDRPNGNRNYGQDHEQPPPSGSGHHQCVLTVRDKHFCKTLIYLMKHLLGFIFYKL
jgi:hypothetical protein